MRAALDRAGVRRAVALVVFLAAWEAAARLDLLNALYFPPPSRVSLALAQLFVDGGVWPHIEATFSAALLGLVLGIVVGAVLGVTAALTPRLAELLEPVMMLLNAIPRVILAPLFVIWFGIGAGSKIALAFILVAVLVFFTVYTGIKEVDRRLVERVATLGGGRAVLLREVYLPSVTAWILGNLKVAVGFAFTGAVVGEFVAASQGLGYLLSFAPEHLQRRPHHGPGGAHHGLRPRPLRPGRPPREASPALALTRTRPVPQISRFRARRAALTGAIALQARTRRPHRSW